MRPIVIVLILSVLASAPLFSQRKKKDNTGAAWLVKAGGGINESGGAWAERFGRHYWVGAGGAYQTEKLWQFGVSGRFFTGNNVKNVDEILNPILNPLGQIFAQSGTYADVTVSQRGWAVFGEVAKTLPVFKANHNSGLHVAAGAGYLSHWVHISNFNDDTPQLMGDFDKGYDQLSGGPALRQSIGYQFLAKNRRVNFNVSLELMQVYSQNYRGYHFGTGQFSDGSVWDFSYGIKAQWILPIYQQPRSQEYFYD